ncbi:MAG: nucleotidyltransferase domain-containing protein [Candidatus Amoebophilus sp.]
MEVYLSGSLSYGDFNPARSDIDLTVVLSRGPIAEELELIKDLHKKIEKKNQAWTNRIECSYIPVDMLRNISPPKIPRPLL